MKETLDEFAQWVIDAFNQDLKNSNNKVLAFAWEINYNDMVSNSHSAPVNGVDNFMGFPDKPRGYPGFQGKIWFRLQREKEFCFIFRKSLTHTGTGSGGIAHSRWKKYTNFFYNMYNDKKISHKYRPHVYKYEFRFYLSDHPTLEVAVEDNKVIFALENSKNKKYQCNHSFVWVDEDCEKSDIEIMSNALTLEHAA